ncbi:hypothetical protein AMAG_06114 [Allomyces macrogynus ATCC 38327]|uniref:Protein-serine/threonine kinase n=1 Tax=Allomyces macrogynus (strain ATCC 38327) TaxID=578462 RepID=A0A0L0SE48_ALLM3|nr:hypothetical protein AMAG_06114 [Allomyces macrogynus ATCC 38327]|eukprot:KNE60756.1 hypothetical protein AMAG_06114 [Allomyces macrogynus ATCC 38327]
MPPPAAAAAMSLPHLASTAAAAAVAPSLSSSVMASALHAVRPLRHSLNARRAAAADPVATAAAAASLVAARQSHAAVVLDDICQVLPTVLAPGARADHVAAALAPLAQCARDLTHAAVILAEDPSVVAAMPVNADDVLVALRAARVRHDAATRALHAAWSPMVGRVIVDRSAMQRVRRLLDAFIASHLGARLALANALRVGSGHQVRDVDPHAVTVKAIHDERAWAQATFGNAPEVVLKNTSVRAHGPVACEASLRAMLRGPLRAAMHAAAISGPPQHPVKVKIVDGREDLAFHISDRGPGLTQRQLADVFHYGLVTAPLAHAKMPALGYSPVISTRDPVPTPTTPYVPAGRRRRSLFRMPATASSSPSPLFTAATSILQALGISGFGTRASSTTDQRTPRAAAPVIETFADPLAETAVREPAMPAMTMADILGVAPPSALGHVLHEHALDLSLARRHARYFGGDLDVVSMENHGTDQYLHLTKDVAEVTEA